jgi:DNA-binding transcriptional LysR family regulator
MSFAENEKIKMSKLQAMELFVIAVREGSFSAAGRRTGLSPASVSRRIGELEARLGIQLFNRTTRHLALTEAGKAYLQRIEPALHSIEDAEAAALALQSTPRGTLRVHSRMLFGMTVVMPLMPEFQKMYPELKVELSLSERRIQLREEDFDVDLRIAAPKDASLMQRRLLAAERILVAAPEYIARMPALRDPSDLAAHNCLTYRMGSNDVVWRFMRKGKLTEMTVPSSFSTNSGYVLHQLAVKGQGIALLDGYTVSAEIERGQLRHLLPSYRVTNSTFDEGIYATFLQSDYLPGKIRAFVDFMAAKVPGQIRKGGLVPMRSEAVPRVSPR